MKSSVGFVGLGRMGVPMARNLVGAGFDMVVYNRSRAASDAFADANGATAVGSPREVGERCSIIVIMVADGPAVLALMDGPNGLAPGLGAEDVVIDMGTTGLADTERLRDRLHSVGAHLVEAPVSGSVAAAEARSLLVVAGGQPDAIDRARPVLTAMASRVIETGGPGTGATMKLAINSVLLGINQAIAESLVLAERAGIDRSVAYEVFASSAVAAPVVHYRRAAFENPGSTPVSFSVDQAVKDLRLIGDVAVRFDASMPQATSNRQVMIDASRTGLGSADIADVAVHLRLQNEGG